MKNHVFIEYGPTAIWNQTLYVLSRGPFPLARSVLVLWIQKQISSTGCLQCWRPLVPKIYVQWRLCCRIVIENESQILLGIRHALAVVRCAESTLSQKVVTPRSRSGSSSSGDMSYMEHNAYRADGKHAKVGGFGRSGQSGRRGGRHTKKVSRWNGFWLRRKVTANRVICRQFVCRVLPLRHPHPQFQAKLTKTRWTV